MVQRPGTQGIIRSIPFRQRLMESTIAHLHPGKSLALTPQPPKSVLTSKFLPSAAIN